MSMHIILQNILNRAMLAGLASEVICESVISIETNNDDNNSNRLYMIGRDSSTKIEYKCTRSKYIGKIDNVDFILFGQIYFEIEHGIKSRKYSKTLINGYGEVLVQDISNCHEVNGVLIIIGDEDNNKRLVSIRKTNMELITQEYELGITSVSKYTELLKKLIGNVMPCLEIKDVKELTKYITREHKLKIRRYTFKTETEKTVYSYILGCGLGKYNMMIHTEQYIESINKVEKSGPFIIDEKGNITKIVAQ